MKLFWLLPLLAILLTASTVNAQDTWRTNTTSPPPGNWIVTIQVNCTSTPCQTRLLQWQDWHLRTVWVRFGSGSFTFPFVFEAQPYFFRVQNGELNVSYNVPEVPITKCPLEHPRLTLALLLLIAALSHGWWLRPCVTKPCPFKGVGPAVTTTA